MRARLCRLTLAFGLAMAHSMWSLASQAPATPPAPAEFYYYGEDQIPLDPADFVAIRWQHEESSTVLASSPQLRATSKLELANQRLAIYPLASPLNTSERQHLLDHLGQLPEIELAVPVYRAPEALMVAGETIIVRFARDLTEEEANQLAVRLDLQSQRQVPWAPSTYLLKTRAGHVLDAANRLNGRPEVLWAHPDFLRIVDRPHVSARGAVEQSLSGRKGESAYISQIAKGSSRIRVAEPTIFSSPPITDSPELPGITSTIDRASLGWEGFEGAFPDRWQLIGDPTWGTATNRQYSGTWSGYAVGSGIAPPGPYPNHADSWMVYGPFSLVGAQAARVDLQAWIQTESYYDFFKIAVSPDGAQWYGLEFSGDWGGWRNIALDLDQVPTLGSLLGRPQVWLALVFESDVSITYEGIYVDEIVIETITGGYENLTSDDFDHLQWSLANHEQTWGVEGVDIKAPEAWGITPGSDTVTIAVIDEGVDLGHPDLIDKLVPGYDATGGGSEGGATGDDAHGTACAALAAAITDNGIGVAGVNREARLMPVRVFVNGYTRDSWAADGIHWAVTRGADVLSNSWGGGLPSVAITEAIEFAVTEGREGRGAVAIFAAGNSNSDTVSYPASLPDTLAVGALSPCDHRKSHTSCDGEFWWGSNYGAALDVIAPGVLMYSADLAGEAGYQPGDYLSNFNGTSSATPLVSGVAALLLGLSPDLPGSSVEAIIMDSARDLLLPGWDAETGHGCLSAFDAVQHLLTSTTDLEAVEVTFRDQPAAGGLLVDSPVVDQDVYPHLRFTVTAPEPLIGRIAAIFVDDDLLCETNDTFENGEHVVWCTTPWKATDGSHDLQGRVDPYALIAEEDEANNTVTVGFEVSTFHGEFFSDGFESGDTTGWSDSIP